MAETVEYPMHCSKAPRFAPLLFLALACGQEDPSPKPDSSNDPVETHDAGDVATAEQTPDDEEFTPPSEVESTPSDDEDASDDESPAETSPDAAQPETASDAGKAEPDPKPLCFMTQTVPDPKNPLCLSDEAWKQRAADECTRGGLVFDSITTAGACEGGNATANYVCCEPPMVDAGVEEPSEECVDTSPGFNPGAPCRTPDELQQRAAASCTNMGLELKVESLRFMFECNGGYKAAAYSCCG